jgi:hypothetical protein
MVKKNYRGYEFVVYLENGSWWAKIGAATVGPCNSKDRALIMAEVIIDRIVEKK